MRYCLLLLLAVLGIGTSSANNITVSNVTVGDELTPSTLGGYFVNINFDLSWENSWRLDVGPGNWDGAYVFAYYRENDGPWIFLGNTIGFQPPGFTIQGFADNGVLYYRDAPGSGDVALTDVYYRGRIQDPDFDPNAELEVRVFATEMVWIPEAEFELGQAPLDTDDVWNQYFKNNSTAGPLSAYTVSSEAGITVGQLNGLQVDVENSNAGLTGGTIPADYPKGHNGFWVMKYEVSQQQYVDFYNMSDPLLQPFLDPTGNDGKGTDATVDRNACTNANGEMTTSLPNVAMNYVNDYMMLRFLAWTGLRPLSEFEYEKACRGTLAQTFNEYAWGNDEIAGSSYTFINGGSPTEGYDDLDPVTGNATYAETADTDGPVRVGAIAASTAAPGRVAAGASYYGVMDLSGNLTEWTVSSSTTEGRQFTDARGRYSLSPPSSWPGSGTVSWALRGGGYDSTERPLRVSDRTLGAVGLVNGTDNVGFRGAVRSGYNSGL